MNSVSPRSPIHHRVCGHRRKPMGRLHPHGQVFSFHNAENDVIFIDSPPNGLQNLKDTRLKPRAQSNTVFPIGSATGKTISILVLGRAVGVEIGFVSNNSGCRRAETGFVSNIWVLRRVAVRQIGFVSQKSLADWVRFAKLKHKRDEIGFVSHIFGVRGILG